MMDKQKPPISIWILLVASVNREGTTSESGNKAIKAQRDDQ
jgi:hypothetical protein